VKIYSGTHANEYNVAQDSGITNETDECLIENTMVTVQRERLCRVIHN